MSGKKLGLDAQQLKDSELGQRVWRLGSVQFDERARQLLVNGEPVALEPRPADLLMLLLRHPNSLIIKEDFFRLVWAGRLVTESVLTKAMAKLRAAMGDETATLVQTVHGLGYRLNAQPQQVEANAGTAALRKGYPLPDRQGWRLQRRLNRPGQWWLAQHDDGRERLLHLAEDLNQLAEMRRELALQSLVFQAGKNPLEAIVDSSLAATPGYLAWSPEALQDLPSWLEAQGGAKDLSPAMRLALVRGICRALAHFQIAGGLGFGGLRPHQFVVHMDSNADSPELRLVYVASICAKDDYSPPEHCSATQQSPQGDVYALGILAYKLLVGDLEARQSPGWHKRLSDPLLVEDLALATQLDPAQRLQTAGSLLERLEQLEQRRLQHADVAAVEQALSRERRRSRQWRQRLVWVGAAAALILLTFAGFHWQAQGLQQRTQQALEVAQALNQFLAQDLLAAADPYSAGGGQQVTVASVLDAALATAPQRFARQPAVLATVMASLGDAYRGLNLYPQAISAHRQAAEAAGLAWGTGARQRAEALQKMGYSLVENDQAEDALKLGAAMVSESKSRRGVQAARFAAAGLHVQGWAHNERGDAAAAEPLLRAALSRHPDSPEDAQSRSDIRWDLGEALTDLGKWADAGKMLDSVARHEGQRAGTSSAVLAWVNTSRARLAMERGDLSTANLRVNEMEAVARQLPPEHRVGLLAQRMRLRLELAAYHPSEALELAERLQPMLEARLGRTHPWTLDVMDIRTQAEIRLNQPQGALTTAREYMQRAALRPSQGSERHSAALALGQSELLAGQPSQHTLSLLSESVGQLETLAAPSGPMLGYLLATRAQFYEHLNLPGSAEDRYQARTVLRQHYGTDLGVAWEPAVALLREAGGSANVAAARLRPTVLKRSDAESPAFRQ